LGELTLTRLRLFVREPSAVFWTFGFPILLSIALGIAFRNRPPEAVHIAIERGSAADAIALALQSPGVRAHVVDAQTAGQELRTGKVSLVVAAREPRTYRYDETRPGGRLARLLVDDLLQRSEGRRDPTPVADDRVTEIGARYVDFLIPGLVGFNLMSSGMWGIGYVIVEMRTKKLVKRMLATPMRRGDFLLSFVAVRALFVFVEVPVLFAFARVAFGLRVAGSPVLLIAVALLGALAFAGLGLLCASRARNTETVGGLMNLVILPMSVGSGVFFSTANFPNGMQPLLRALPLTALNDALRAVANDAAGVPEIRSQIALLAAWALLSFAGALGMFRWT
jgi:ABC-type polysaccharide/polyol phosphate export permease